MYIVFQEMLMRWFCIIIIFVKMDVDIDDAPVPDGHILVLMASNIGCSCAIITVADQL